MPSVAKMALTVVTFLAAPCWGATIEILVADAAGEGFNDETAVVPVGGNPGTTLGEQRLIAFEYAASVFEALLDSDVTIVIQAQFDPLTCSQFSGTLGSAGAEDFVRDFTNAPLASTWFPIALANSYAGGDLIPESPDINATFNSNVNGSEGCLNGAEFYLGLDNNPPGDEIDLIPVLLHEFSHGLGFLTLVNRSTGVLPGGFMDTFSIFLHDLEIGKDWSEMTNAERAASALNDPDLVWTGETVTNAIPEIPLTEGTNEDFLRLFAPEVLVGGSSVSHWTSDAEPDLLMEPSLSDGLTSDIDLTRDLLADIGWQFLPQGEPEIAPSPPSLNFGFQNIDTGASAAKSITVNNSGTADLNISSVTLTGVNSGEFNISSDSGEAVLEPLEARLIEITFNPATAESKAASLSIGSNDGDEPTVLISLSGTGFDPDLGVGSPVYVDFAFAGEEQGTQPLPFNTTAEGAAYVSVGGTVNFDAGSSTETGTFGKAMTWASTGGIVRIGGL